MSWDVMWVMDLMGMVAWVFLLLSGLWIVWFRGEGEFGCGREGISNGITNFAGIKQGIVTAGVSRESGAGRNPFAPSSPPSPS